MGLGWRDLEAGIAVFFSLVMLGLFIGVMFNLYVPSKIDAAPQKCDCSCKGVK